MARPGRLGNDSDEIIKAKLSKENWKDALTVFRYIKPYKWAFFGGLLAISLSSVTTLALPYFFKQLIDSADALRQGKEAIPTGRIALWMVGVLVAQVFLSFSRVYLFTRAGENALADLRSDVYRTMIRLPMDFFAQRRVGELSSRLSSDLGQIQDAVTFMLAEIIRGVLTLVIGIGLILYLSPKLTLVMLSVIPVVVIIAVVFGRFIRKLSRKAQDQLGDSNTIVQESLQGIANVKSFSNEWFETARYSNSLKNVVALAMQSGKARGMFISFMLFSLFGAIILVVWFGVGLMQQGELSFGDLTAFVVYTSFVGGSMAGFADLYSNLQKTLGATQRVREILREETEQVSIHEESVQEPFRMHGDVEFRHVAFSYPTRREVPVLRDISLHARKGQQIALVGPSGAGKSTIASLLLRFYEPDTGGLFFDGRPASEIPISQLRLQMAVVPQDILLFGGTIRENIAYGKPAASQEEIEEAARKAHAHEFIQTFPEAYETVVGERGIKLSGGQRQRIAIARAILKDPVILILDEATSSLDSASEALVQDALENLMKNRTSFVIAHRLSTIRNAHQIIVLEKGLVREKGTHEELMSNTDGLYSSLSRLQLDLD
ncbi:MAG: ABC transporter ATP-binding protein/permease [Chitinophagaceae bacterium]|jgi:ABC-type multidrug transport system fused ATPase/permease subunit|nr:ABC transporter ATP-binding protein/permease [Chitinophagaceae bacterium]